MEPLIWRFPFSTTLPLSWIGMPGGGVHEHSAVVTFRIAVFALLWRITPFGPISSSESSSIAGVQFLFASGVHTRQERFAWRERSAVPPPRPRRRGGGGAARPAARGRGGGGAGGGGGGRGGGGGGGGGWWGVVWGF